MLSITKQKLNLDAVEESDIDLCYRLGRAYDSKVRDVIVKFTSRDKRNLVYRCKRNMPREDPAIFINEDLTQTRNKLFFDARCMKKHNKIKAAWTQDGHIMIKLTEASDPVPIQTHSDLRNALYGDNCEQLSGYSDYSDTDFDSN